MSEGARGVEGGRVDCRGYESRQEGRFPSDKKEEIALLSWKEFRQGFLFVVMFVV